MSNKLTIEYVKQKLKKLHPGSTLLSKEYRNNYTKLNIVCEKGHEFKSSWTIINNKNSWCPKCAGKKKKTIEDVIKFINEKHPNS